MQSKLCGLNGLDREYYTVFQNKALHLLTSPILQTFFPSIPEGVGGFRGPNNMTDDFSSGWKDVDETYSPSLWGPLRVQCIPFPLTPTFP